MSGIKKITDEVKSAVAKSVEPMKNLNERAKEMASKSASSISQMKAKMKSYSTSIQETAKQQEYLKTKIENLKDLLNKADMGFEVGDIFKIEAEIERLENQLKKLQNQGQKTGKETSGAFDKIKSTVKSAGKHMVGLGSKFKTVLSGSKNLGKGMATTFNSGIKSMKRFAFGLLSVRTAFSMISKAMQSYLSYDTQLSDSIQNCWNVLGSLLAPILELIVSLFSKAVSYVNAFVQALTGINLVARANTKALNNQSKSTKKLSEAQSSLDEFHTVNADSGSSGSGEKNPITVENVNFDSLKDKLLNTDWYVVGNEIGKKINEALRNINWNFIQSLAISLGKKLGNLLNGLIDGLDWALIGSSVGNGLNTLLLFVYTFFTTFDWGQFGIAIATGINNTISTINWTLLGQTFASKISALIDSAYGFVTTFDWGKFGTSIGEAIMGFFNDIDWAKAGETLSTGIRGLFTSVKNLIASIDWQALGNDVWKFISNIDWAGMIKDLAFILGQAIAGIGQFVWGFIEDGVKSIGDYFTQKIEECGGNVVAGLFKGIIDAFVGIGEWLYNNILVPFIDGFKSMFGIHSPSTVMAELGTFLVDGLKNGLANIWEKLKEIFNNFKTNISNIFTESLNTIKNIFSIENIKNHFSEILSKIKDIFSSIPTWFKNIFTDAWTNVKNVFSAGGKIFTGIKEGIEKTFKTVVNGIISGINKIISIPFKSINKMLNKIRNIEFLNISPFKGLWGQDPLKVPQIPSLETGGVLDKETIVRVAEYSNAKSNPEIVSPRDMMKETMKEALEESRENYRNQQVDVNITGELTAKGDDLVYVYDKNKKDKGYDGKKNPSFAY